jgi:hypothetical protein
MTWRQIGDTRSWRRAERLMPTHTGGRLAMHGRIQKLRESGVLLHVGPTGLSPPFY